MSLSVHLDPCGGVAGDMFAAAMLDAFPVLEAPLRADLAAVLGSVVEPLTWRGSSRGLAVLRVQMAVRDAPPATGHWRDIRALLQGSALAPPVRDGALAVFGLLADAEAHCHGVPSDDVHFHEIADWDSLADIVAAASLAHRSGVVRWTVGELPLGEGMVMTAHGGLPLPAPATARLLEGFAVHRDGERGERVTPTGAAILRHLVADPKSRPTPGRLKATGTGAGSRELDQRPNTLRVLVTEAVADPCADRVARLSFEIDDMTPEEIGVALDRLRADAGVLDAGFTLGYGKKSRPRFAVEILARPEAAEAVAAACLLETSTLGLRLEVIERRLLARSAKGGDPRTKRAERPGGATCKAESDDLAAIPGLAARRATARAAEGNEE
jgi:uncharacterized protein (TIGR00299 family) protein